MEFYWIKLEPHKKEPDQRMTYHILMFCHYDHCSWLDGAKRLLHHFVLGAMYHFVNKQLRVQPTELNLNMG